jgi:hypothetical protein
MKDNEYEIPERAQSDGNMLDMVILIANICMAPIFTHTGRMARDYGKDTSVRQLVIC